MHVGVDERVLAPYIVIIARSVRHRYYGVRRYLHVRRVLREELVDLVEVLRIKYELVCNRRIASVEYAN